MDEFDEVKALHREMREAEGKPQLKGVIQVRDNLLGTELTDFELQTLQLIEQGLSNREISLLLFLSEDAVKSRSRRCFAKLGAKDRAHAVGLAYQKGILVVPSAPKALPDVVVAGYCPMGCGQTLRAYDGHVGCGADRCPRPNSVNEILADDETDHVVVVTEDGFHITHPLKDRVTTGIAKCLLHPETLRRHRRFGLAPGTYKARPVGLTREWDWEKVS